MKKYIISAFEGFFTYIAILIYTNSFYDVKSFNIFMTLIFFFLWYFYYKYDKKFDKKINKYSIVLSFLISTMLSLGNIVSHYIKATPTYIFNINKCSEALIMMVGFGILLYKLFGFLFIKVKKISIFNNHEKFSKKYFITTFLIVFFGNFLYFIRFYPAIMTPDSYHVIHYADDFILSDFHTFGHTWFFGIPFNFGKLLFNNLNDAVAFSTIVQMICISFIVTIVIRFLYNKGLSKIICFLVVLIYAFSPLYGHYSITLWRDVMFGTAFMLLFIVIFNFIDNKECQKSDIVLFVISILFILFFRNNGIYVFVFIIPFMIFILKNKRKTITILCACLLVFYFGIKGPVFDYFGVEKTKTSEAYSIPLQQMARVVVLNENISVDDSEFLRKLWDYDKVIHEYSNVISNPVKWATDDEFLQNNSGQFFKTYLNLFIQHPRIYFEAYMLQTLGYWYPDVIYWVTGSESKQLFDENVYTDSLTPEIYNKLIDHTTYRELPLSNLIWSVGGAFFVLIISSFLTFYYNKKYILCYIPLYGIWLSIMVATPVFCELRYVYGIFTCVPLLILLPFLVNKKKDSNI